MLDGTLNYQTGQNFNSRQGGITMWVKPTWHHGTMMKASLPVGYDPFTGDEKGSTVLMRQNWRYAGNRSGDCRRKWPAGIQRYTNDSDRDGEATCVTSGERAVAYYAHHRDEIDLVLLDIAMPGMSGQECFDELRRIDPGVKVLFSSGHARDGDQPMASLDGAVGFLQKPYDVEEFSEAVATAMAQARQADPDDAAPRSGGVPR